METSQLRKRTVRWAAILLATKQIHVHGSSFIMVLIYLSIAYFTMFYFSPN